MAKEDRLQLRMERDLKEWFRLYSDERGGMSAVVVDLVRRLRRRVDRGDGRQRDA